MDSEQKPLANSGTALPLPKTAVNNLLWLPPISFAHYTTHARKAELHFESSSNPLSFAQPPKTTIQVQEIPPDCHPRWRKSHPRLHTPTQKSSFPHPPHHSVQFNPGKTTRITNPAPHSQKTKTWKSPRSKKLQPNGNIIHYPRRA